MSRVFNPVYSSTSDGSDVTLCRILEAVAAVAAPVSDGMLPHTKVSVSGVNATVVKASYGKVYNFIATNVSNQTKYVKFFDTATTPNPSTDSADYIIPLQNGQTITLALGTAPFVFHNGISYAMTTSASGAGNVGAGDLVLSLTYL